MKTKIEQTLDSTPAWALALLICILSTLLLFGIGYPLEVITLGEIPIGDWISHVSTGIFISIACFIIVKHHPAADWYVPLLANGLSFLAALVEPNFWRTPLTINKKLKSAGFKVSTPPLSSQERGRG